MDKSFRRVANDLFCGSSTEVAVPQKGNNLPAFNIRSTLQKRGCKVYVISFLYSKCSTFKAAWVCGQSYASISHNPTKCA